MTNQFGIPKTDLNTMCERSDLELIDNFQTETDSYLRLQHLKKIANDAFDLNDAANNRNEQITLPAQTVCFNPFSRSLSFFYQQSNTCCDSTTLTDTALQIAYDYIPVYDTFPSPVESINESSKANSGNFNTVAGGASLVQSIRCSDYDSNIRDDTLATNGRGWHKLSFDKYIIVYDSVYYTAASCSSSSLGGDTAVSGGIDNPYGSTICTDADTPTSAVRTQLVGGYQVTRFGAVSPAVRLAISGAGLVTHSNTIAWWTFVRTGVTAPGAYPSKTRTLTTAYTIFRITGTNMKNVISYMNANTVGGSFTLEYSIDNINYYSMTQIYNNSNDHYHKASITGTTNTFYIKLTMNGTAGTSCIVSRFAGEGI